MKVKLKDVENFIVGNYRFFKNKLIASPDYIKEQIYYRLSVCADDCLITNKCQYCPCPPKKKAWVTESCNDGERFPDLMNKDEWEQYKQDNNIEL